MDENAVGSRGEGVVVRMGGAVTTTSGRRSSAVEAVETATAATTAKRRSHVKGASPCHMPFSDSSLRVDERHAARSKIRQLPVVQAAEDACQTIRRVEIVGAAPAHPLH
jgi:hypothetical protein